MVSSGLVLEGGGMRGVYTAGVLEYFMEKELYFPYVIGVSAGACMGASYVSRQKGRNKTVNIEYVSHPQYLSLGNYIRHKQLFGMDFIFDEIPNKLVPFHYDAFLKSDQTFKVGTTDCVTGEAVYYEKNDVEMDILTLLRASSSLPFIAPMIEYKGRKLLDGGIADSIPVKKSEEDGNVRNVVILTRNADYRKKKAAWSGWSEGRLNSTRSLQMLCWHATSNTTAPLTILKNKSKRGTYLSSGHPKNLKWTESSVTLSSSKDFTIRELGMPKISLSS